MNTMLKQRGATASAVRLAAPTATELKARASAIKTELPALVAARNALSVAYLAGDLEAIEASNEIDAKRAKLIAEQEHLDVAIKEVSALERANPVLAGRELDRLKQMLRATIIERRENLTYNLTHGSLRDNRENEIAAALTNIDPLTIAREICQPIAKQVVAHDGEDRARLTAERNRIISKLANDLVEATQLPPLPPEIAKVSAP